MNHMKQTYHYHTVICRKMLRQHFFLVTGLGNIVVTSSFAPVVTPAATRGLCQVILNLQRVVLGHFLKQTDAVEL